MNSDFLKRFFQWSDEVVDAAQSPAAKLASTLLPILAPLVPAFVTSIRLHGMYSDLIAGRFPSWVATTGAVITALVLEFLGWVGTIAFVRSLYKWIKTKEDGYMLPSVFSFIAYALYVADMWTINSKFANKDTVFLLLSLFSIPAGFLFAVTLVGNESDKDDEKHRQEERNERLEKVKIRAAAKAGYNPYAPVAVVNEQAVAQVKEKHAGDFKESAFALLDETWNGSHAILSPRQLTDAINKKHRVNLDHNKCKGTWTNFTKEWKQAKGLR